MSVTRYRFSYEAESYDVAYNWIIAKQLSVWLKLL